MQRDQLTVSAIAIDQAKDLGIFGDVDARLKRMARRSAPITHDLGNRRFDDYVLLVENDEIKGIWEL